VVVPLFCGSTLYSLQALLVRPLEEWKSVEGRLRSSKVALWWEVLSLRILGGRKTFLTLTILTFAI
jgi:hypothetical protein